MSENIENVLLETIAINSIIDISLKDDETLKINDIELSYYHSQDCCESVYADWKAIKDQVKDVNGKEVKILEIKAVPEMGILLSFDDTYKYFVPCYNSQNGYYGSDLELIIKNVTKKINITKFVKDNID